MGTLRTNILANYAGQIWMAAMGVVFLPIYIQILGMEAFGVVGLLLSFQAMLQLFDFGIGGTCNRELSRRAHDPTLAEGARNLVRTSEVIIWLLALAVLALIYAGSGLMAGHWLHLDQLSESEARQAIVIMGVAIALLWPSTFYAHCMFGLEQQPRLNTINAAFTTLRFAGVLPVLLWISPTITAFLWWFAIVGAAQSLTMAWATWQVLPTSHRRPRWSIAELGASRHFAGGLFTVGMLGLCISQLDRLTLASMRPLEELGYYTLAISVASGLGRMVHPMFNAIYPRFSRLVARHEPLMLCKLYHLGSQYLVVVVAAVAMVLIGFAHGVLILWTGNTSLASEVALPLTILVAGSAFNGLMNIPYALQLAHGWTRLGVGINTVSLLLGIPFCIWAVHTFGVTGAALLWLFYNLASFLVGIPLMHRRLLRGQLASWYLRDNLPPILVAVLVTLLLVGILPPITRSLTGLAWLALASGTVLMATALASRAVRRATGKWLSPLLRSLHT